MKETFYTKVVDTGVDAYLIKDYMRKLCLAEEKDCSVRWSGRPLDSSAYLKVVAYPEAYRNFVAVLGKMYPKSIEFAEVYA